MEKNGIDGSSHRGTLSALATIALTVGLAVAMPAAGDAQVGAPGGGGVGAPLPPAGAPNPPPPPPLRPAQPVRALTDAERARFEAGMGEFAEVEDEADGLGPVFNGRSCAECHNQPTIGGSSPRFVTRFGRYVGGEFDPLAELGGSLIQENGIVTDTCSVGGEVVPREATVRTRRDTPALFGDGFIDAIADKRILRAADPDDRDGDGISGRPNLIGGRVGKFGWKGQVVSVHDFAGDAYLNEMGITSPGFPNENNPQGGPVVCDAVPDPEDDGSGVESFTDFMTMIAPLPTGTSTPQTRIGRTVFRRLRCDSCHVRALRTGDSPVPALSRRRARLYSDLLLHDMGPALADGIEQGDATGSEFRTPPLWGVGQSAPYLHDGRAATLSEAIAAHGGEARASRDGFLRLGGEQRDALVAYLNTL